jgi:hypothetical protein
MRYQTALTHISKSEKLSWGEGLMYGLLLNISIAAILIIIAIINLAFKRDQYKFYLWLCVAVAIPFIAIVYI